MSSSGCQSPPPPPPPPPPVLLDNVPQRKNHYPLLRKIIETVIWSATEPELEEACSRNTLFVLKEPDIWRYTFFESLLQEGPMCGIVALSMMLRRMMMPDELLNHAKVLGYSNNGEMFSTKSMYHLCQFAKDKLELESFNITHRKGKLSDKEHIDALIDGCKILVPYDSDKNSAPCLKNGHSAHWALVTGVLIQKKDYDLNDVYVTAKHGKSKYLAIWKLKDLCASNLNLKEMSVERANDPLEYILPEGGLDGPDGLSGQFIIIKD